VSLFQIDQLRLETADEDMATEEEEDPEMEEMRLKSETCMFRLAQRSHRSVFHATEIIGLRGIINK